MRGVLVRPRDVLACGEHVLGVLHVGVEVRLPLNAGVVVGRLPPENSLWRLVVYAARGGATRERKRYSSG